MLSLLIAIVVYLKNAWVTEDAYILFRSLEQLFAGNGPVYNPHDRVQAFTSPLWFLVLAAARIFSANVYLNAIIVSLILLIATTFVLQSVFKNNGWLLLAILLLGASNAFFDYTSAGLENGLAYLIIALYMYNYLELFNLHDNQPSKVAPESRINAILLLFGLIILTRHDLALLLMPPTAYTVWTQSRAYSKKQWLIWVSIALAPFLLFSLFAIIYYGFPFPNTAYAKLNTGIEKSAMIKQGLTYFYATLKYDTITFIIVVGALILTIIKPPLACLRYLGYGIILNLFYVVYVGGDFMQGRFFSYAYLVATILLGLVMLKWGSAKVTYLGFIAVISYFVFFPHTPFTSDLSYTNNKITDGVADERGFYFPYLSLYRYLRQDPGQRLFPDIQLAREGWELKNSDKKVETNGYIGVLGYHAGTKIIILDYHALVDPLLARMPVTGPWRIGHFPREIPKGYYDSLVNESNVIKNPQIREFYQKLKVITQDEALFTLERFKTIILFNLGFYNDLPGPVSSKT